MAFFAKIIDDQDLAPAPKIVMLPKGMRGTRHYFVPCADPDVCWLAGGLPKIGEPWSNQWKTLKAVRIEPTKHSGAMKDPNADIPGGLTIFEVEYETPGLTGKIPYTEGLKFTRFDSSVTEITVYNDAGEDDNDPFKGGLIAQGRGAQKKVPTLACSVLAYYPMSWDGLKPILAVQGFVSKDKVQLPPLLGAVQGFTMDPGQVLFLNAEVDQVASLIEVRFNLELAPDFLFRYQRENADGVGVGPVYNANVYSKAELGNLW